MMIHGRMEGFFLIFTLHLTCNTHLIPLEGSKFLIFISDYAIKNMHIWMLKNMACLRNKRTYSNLVLERNVTYFQFNCVSVMNIFGVVNIYILQQRNFNNFQKKIFAKVRNTTM